MVRSNFPCHVALYKLFSSISTVSCWIPNRSTGPAGRKCWPPPVSPSPGNITAINASESTTATCCAPWPARPIHPATGIASGRSTRPRNSCFRTRMTAPPFEPDLARHAPRPSTATFKLAVVSSSSRSEIEPLLVDGGIREHFDTVVGGGDVKTPKALPGAVPAGRHPPRRGHCPGARGFRRRNRQRTRRGLRGHPRPSPHGSGRPVTPALSAGQLAPR